MVEVNLSDRMILHMSERLGQDSVPKGKTLGPLLWSNMYKMILKVGNPEGYEDIALANDIPLIIKDR